MSVSTDAEGLAGLDGAVRIEGSPVASLRSWTWTRETNLVETGGFGDDYAKEKPSRKRGSGSAQGIFAKGDAAGQGAVESAYEDNTRVALELQLETGKVYTIQAYISQLEVGATYDGVTTFNFNFSQWGSPTTLADHS